MQGVANAEQTRARMLTLVHLLIIPRAPRLFLVEYGNTTSAQAAGANTSYDSQAVSPDRHTQRYKVHRHWAIGHKLS
jgi:hypothetical protein